MTRVMGDFLFPLVEGSAPPRCSGPHSSAHSVHQEQPQKKKRATLRPRNWEREHFFPERSVSVNAGAAGRCWVGPSIGQCIDAKGSARPITNEKEGLIECI